MDIVQNSLLVLFLQAIPEKIAFSLLVVAITNDLKNWKKAVFVGIGLAFALHFIRSLDFISFGIHALIFMGMAVILYEWVLNSRFTIIVVSVMIGMMLIVAGELLSFLLVTYFVGLTLEEMAKSTFWWIVSGWLHIIITLIVAHVIYIKNKNSGGKMYA